MSQAAKSVFAWGIYMFATGGAFLLAPNAFLPLFGFAPTSEVWLRMGAMLAIALGYYYVQAARHDLKPLFAWKVHAHIFGVLCMLAFVVLRLGPPTLLLFAAADAVAGTWTALALRQDQARALRAAPRTG